MDGRGHPGLLDREPGQLAGLYCPCMTRATGLLPYIEDKAGGRGGHFSFFLLVFSLGHLLLVGRRLSHRLLRAGHPPPSQGSAPRHRKRLQIGLILQPVRKLWCIGCRALAFTGADTFNRSLTGTIELAGLIARRPQMRNKKFIRGSLSAFLSVEVKPYFFFFFK